MKKGMVRFSVDENCKICKNQRFLIPFFIFILLISISFISAQKYTLKVTEEHPFFLNGEWIPAKNLQVGDLLFTDDGKKAKITAIKEIDDNVEVYNLEAKPFNDFVVSGNVVVHNSDPVSLINAVDLNTLSVEEIGKLNLARSLLKVESLTEAQKKAVIAAHRYGTRRADGTYPWRDIRMKVRILNQAFSQPESLRLVGGGAVGEGVAIYTRRVGTEDVAFFIDTEQQITTIDRYPRGMSFEDFQRDLDTLMSGLNTNEITQMRCMILDTYREGLEAVALSGERSSRERALALKILKVLGEDVGRFFRSRKMSRAEIEYVQSVWASWTGGNRGLGQLVADYPELIIYQLQTNHWVIEVKGHPEFGFSFASTPSDINAWRNNAATFRRLLEAFWKHQNNEIRTSLGMPCEP